MKKTKMTRAERRRLPQEIIDETDVAISKLKDTLHADGSKTYETFNRGFITIINQAFVRLIETILANDMCGFSYVGLVQKFVDDGFDTENEVMNVLSVLD